MFGIHSPPVVIQSNPDLVTKTLEREADHGYLGKHRFAPVPAGASRLTHLRSQPTRSWRSLIGRSLTVLFSSGTGAATIKCRNALVDYSRQAGHCLRSLQQNGLNSVLQKQLKRLEKKRRTLNKALADHRLNCATPAAHVLNEIWRRNLDVFDNDDLLDIRDRLCQSRDGKVDPVPTDQRRLKAQLTKVVSDRIENAVVSPSSCLDTADADFEADKKRQEKHRAAYKRLLNQFDRLMISDAARKELLGQRPALKSKISILKRNVDEKSLLRANVAKRQEAAKSGLAGTDMAVENLVSSLSDTSAAGNQVDMVKVIYGSAEAVLSALNPKNTIKKNKILSLLSGDFAVELGKHRIHLNSIIKKKDYRYRMLIVCLAARTIDPKLRQPVWRAVDLLARAGGEKDVFESLPVIHDMLLAKKSAIDVRKDILETQKLLIEQSPQ